MNNDKLTSAVYVDLSKNFDTIGHSVLLQKFSTYGVKDKEHEWFNSYLTERIMFVSTEIFLVQSQSTVEFPKGRSWGHYCLLLLPTTRATT